MDLGLGALRHDLGLGQLEQWVKVAAHHDLEAQDVVVLGRQHLVDDLAALLEHALDLRLGLRLAAGVAAGSRRLGLLLAHVVRSRVAARVARLDIGANVAERKVLRALLDLGRKRRALRNRGLGLDGRQRARRHRHRTLRDRGFRLGLRVADRSSRRRRVIAIGRDGARGNRGSLRHGEGSRRKGQEALPEGEESERAREGDVTKATNKQQEEARASHGKVHRKGPLELGIAISTGVHLFLRGT